MAELDKNAILSMLEGLMEQGAPKASAANAEAHPLSHLPDRSSSSSEELFDTAAMMREMSKLMQHFQAARNTREAALLSALKPYLRTSRQPKVDSCMKLLQAYEVFRSMKNTKKPTEIT